MWQVRVKFNALHECGVRAIDDPQIEVLAQDLPGFGSAQLEPYLAFCPIVVHPLYFVLEPHIQK